MIRLNQENLTKLSSKVILPKYNRSQIKPGILHIGLGNFQRAHQAVYLDDLLQLSGMENWGMISSAIRRDQQTLSRHMNEQNGLYTLIACSSSEQKQARVIGSIIQTLDAAENPEKLIELIADPAIKILTVTVTEGGYYLSSEDDSLLENHPDIKTDLKGGYRTIYSYLKAGLKKRMETSKEPLTLLSCDNLKLNGDKFKKGFSDFLKLTEEREILEQCLEKTTFPNSMVDRITPKSSPELRTETAKIYSYDDLAPVKAESYIQWVLEDNFAGSRPPFEKVGVETVSDVHEQEETKIRILNGGHCAVAWLAAHKQYVFFHDAMRDPALEKFFDEYFQHEISPTLSFVNFDINRYYQTVKERFKNASVPDSIERLAAEGASRLPKFVLPVIYGCFEKNIPVKYGFEILVWWFLALEKDRKNQLHFKHYEQESELVDKWFGASQPFQAFLEDSDFWGYKTRNKQKFTDGMTETYQRLKSADF